MDTSKLTAHANDNRVEHKVAEALDRESHAMLMPLMLGKFDKTIRDASNAYSAHGGEKGGLGLLMQGYKRKVESVRDGQNNYHVRAELIDRLGGDEGLADQFIRATLLTETALDLMAVVAQPYMGGSVSTERDPVEKARLKLVDDMVDFGGVGRTQANVLSQNFIRNVRSVAAEALGQSR